VTATGHSHPNWAGHSDGIGPLAEEATKLLAAAQEWARTTFSSESIATGSSDCAWCPVCRLVTLLRGDRPETTEKIIEAVNVGVTALRALASALTTPSDTAHSQDG
jgi:hypothetical protein